MDKPLPILTVALQKPAAQLAPSSDTVATGLPIAPLERIRLFGSGEWEDFILEWVDSRKSKYASVERCSGAGDMGRDVIAYSVLNDGSWDNFQCKHYGHRLQPGDVWIELGKLVYYTYTKRFTYPSRYFFVAPQGVGPTLSRLLRHANELKAGLLDNWDKKCKNNITKGTEIPLGESMKAYIEGLDFSIFRAPSPLDIINEHRATPWYVARFGGGLPQRLEPDLPPDEPTQEEARYIRQLLDAYGEYLNKDLGSPSDISTADIQEHFKDSRTEFYSAESLRAFSRDSLPPGEFEKLQREFLIGIRDEVRADHPDGYRRLLSAVRVARSLHIAAHALVSRLSMLDIGGICHQLANEDKVRWKNGT